MRHNVPAAAWAASIACAVFLGSILASAATALAQADVLNELYGSGVHAYNSGAYREAYDDFSMALRSGSKDPRVYYYRGLAYLKLGRPQEARLDFKKAAALEMGDTDHFYPVSKSLERVQGQARVQIERARADARLVAYQAVERSRYERYQRIRKNEPNVLMAPEEATEIPTPPKPADEPPEDAAETKPEAEAPEPEMTDDEPAVEMPAEKPEADENDPFAEKEKEADDKDAADEMPAEEGDDEKKPAEEMTEEGDAETPADEAEQKDAAEKPADEKGDVKKPAEEKDPFAE